VKPLACFCALCVENMWDEYANVKWIKDWISKHLQPTYTRYAREFMNNVWDGEWPYGVDGDELVANLEVGDNFVINAEEGNNERQDF